MRKVRWNRPTPIWPIVRESKRRGFQGARGVPGAFLSVAVDPLKTLKRRGAEFAEID
jgi:hypothetical protein